MKQILELIVEIIVLGILYKLFGFEISVFGLLFNIKIQLTKLK